MTGRVRPRVLVGAFLTFAVMTTALEPSASAAAKKPATPLFAKTIDALAKHESESGKCRSTALPGTKSFSDIIKTTYGKNQTIYWMRACNDGGASAHKQGRGIDWMISGSTGRANATAYIDWLLATDKYGNKYAMARRLGVAYIIYNKKIWSADATSKGWRKYTGESDHTDHIHISLTWNGANKKTTYWTSQLKPPVPKPAPKPTPKPTPSPSTTPPSTTPPKVAAERVETAVTTWGDRIDVFSIGQNKSVQQKTFANGKWTTAWYNLGGTTTSGVAATAWANGRLDLFIRGTNNVVYQKTWDGKWGEWVGLGQTINGTPFVTSSGPGNLDLVVRNTGDQMLYRQFRNNAWGSWITIDKTTKSTPAAVMTNDNTMQLFIRGANNTVETATWSANNIGSWTNLGGNATNGIGATFVDWKFHIYARGAGNALFEKVINVGSNTDNAWTNLGGQLGSGASATISGSKVVVSAAGIYGPTFVRTLSGTTWSTWADLGGATLPAS